MFQKINEKRKNQNCDENKIHISRNKNKRNFNDDDFLFISTLKNIIIWTKKDMKQKINRSSKERRFNKFAIFY